MPKTNKMTKMSLADSNNNKEVRKHPSWRMPSGKGLKVTCKGFFWRGSGPS